MKSLLLAQRVCTTFRGLVRYQIRLQRQLWFIDTNGATRADLLEDPDYVDPPSASRSGSVLRLRSLQAETEDSVYAGSAPGQI